MYNQADDVSDRGTYSKSVQIRNIASPSPCTVAAWPTEFIRYFVLWPAVAGGLPGAKAAPKVLQLFWMWKLIVLLGAQGKGMHMKRLCSEDNCRMAVPSVKSPVWRFLAVGGTNFKKIAMLINATSPNTQVPHHQILKSQSNSQCAVKILTQNDDHRTYPSPTTDCWHLACLKSSSSNSITKLLMAWKAPRVVLLPAQDLHVCVFIIGTLHDEKLLPHVSLCHNRHME